MQDSDCVCNACSGWIMRFIFIFTPKISPAWSGKPFPLKNSLPRPRHPTFPFISSSGRMSSSNDLFQQQDVLKLIAVLVLPGFGWFSDCRGFVFDLWHRLVNPPRLCNILSFVISGPHGGWLLIAKRTSPRKVIAAKGFSGCILNCKATIWRESYRESWYWTVSLDAEAWRLACLLIGLPRG